MVGHPPVPAYLFYSFQKVTITGAAWSGRTHEPETITPVGSYYNPGRADIIPGKPVTIQNNPGIGIFSDDRMKMVL